MDRSLAVSYFLQLWKQWLYFSFLTSFYPNSVILHRQTWPKLVNVTSCSCQHPNITCTLFFNPRNNLLVLFGWRNATPCLVLSHLILSCMALYKPPPYMLWLLATPAVIGLHSALDEHYMFKVWNGYLYLLKNHKLKITKHPEKAWPGNTRQDKTVPRRESVRSYEK